MISCMPSQNDQMATIFIKKYKPLLLSECLKNIHQYFVIFVRSMKLWMLWMISWMKWWVWEGTISWKSIKMSLCKPTNMIQTGFQVCNAKLIVLLCDNSVPHITIVRTTKWSGSRLQDKSSCRKESEDEGGCIHKNTEYRIFQSWQEISIKSFFKVIEKRVSSCFATF